MSNDSQEIEQEGPDYDTEAREMGWVDKDDFSGPEDKWVDAKTFIERGEHIMPIMRANNKRLKNDLLTRDKEIANLKLSVDSADKAIKALQKGYTESTRQAVEKAKTDLREQLKQAREVGDFDAEEEIRDKLEDLKESGKEVREEVVDAAKDNNAPPLHPDFVAWNKDNPWFGNMADAEDRKRTRNIKHIGEDLREDGDTTTGRAFLDKCLALLEKREGKNTNRTVSKPGSSKVESSAPGARTSSGGRAFDNLPKEAKEVCHGDNDTFVGPGKMFKSVKEWEDHYARLYSED